MSRSNFRIKVDLSRYYQDIRQFCWIFIDGTKILSISDMKKHIKKLFNITEPYHLCLNNTEYLPPFEDARIVKENETIVVVPGSGLNDEIGSVTDIVSTFVQDNNINNKKDNITCNHKEAQTVEYSVKEVIQTPTKEKEQPLQTNELLSNFKDDLSSMDVTFHSIVNDTEDNNSTDSKTMNITVTEDCEYMEKAGTSAKRKRVRHRKGKKNKDISSSTKDNNDDEVKTKKPKVVDSLVLSSSKHIRFDTDETDENVISQEYVIEPTLSKLFELRNSSTPLTFRNHKIKEEMSTQQNISDNGNEKDDTNVSNEKENETLNNNNFETNTSSKEINNSVKNPIYSDVELEQYVPVKMQDLENLDVIAFKMLTMGKDYTPEISQMIIAQVIACDKKSGSSTLKIIKGLDQIYDNNVPMGKFSISDEETNNKASVILNLHYSKMIEPCVVKKLSTNKV